MANGTDIAKAYVQIIPSADGIKGSLEKLMGGEAESSGKSAGGKFAKFFGGALKTGAAAVAGAAAGATALTSALVAGANETANYGDNVDKMSQKLGLSTDAYQKWDYVLSQSGADISSMGTGLKTLTNKLDDAKNGSESAQQMFAALGLSMEDLNSMSREDVFAATITGFQGMADSTERAALANDLFGKSGQELTPLFNTSVEETQAMMQAAEDLGMVMSGDAVKASANFRDSLDTLKRSVGGAKNSLLAEFLPAMTSVTDGLTALFNGDEGGLQMITVGIDAFIDHLSQSIPSVMKAGSHILVSLVEAIVSNMPALVDAAITAIETLTTGLLTPDNIVLLVDAALDILLALADGLVTALPIIIEATVTLITTLCDRLTNPDSIAKLLKAALDILIALAKGLIKAIPQLLTALGTVAKNLYETIKKWGPTLVTRGKEILFKIGEGIRNVWEQAKDWGSGIVTRITGAISNAYWTVVRSGRELIDKIREGIHNKWDQAKNWGTDLIGKITGAISDAFWTVVRSGRDLISKFGEGIQNIWSKATDWGSTVVSKIVSAISGALWTVVSAGRSLLNSVGEGIRNTWNSAISWGSDIVSKIKGGISNAISSLKNVGFNIVQGLWNGISNGYTWIIGKIRGWVTNVMDYLKYLFKIGSPSKWARDEIGINLAKGIGIGFEDGMSDVEKAMKASIPDVGMTVGTSALKAAPSYNYGGVTIQILGRGKDAEQLAIEMQNALVRRAAVWA